KCHTPSLVRLVACARDPGVFPPSTRIRSGSSTSPRFPESDNNTLKWECVEGKGFEITHYIPINQVNEEKVSPTSACGPWERIAQDIAKSRLYVHEVLL